MLAQTECIEDTCREVHCVAVVVASTVDTSTYERNEVPNACLVVTIDHVAKVEENVLVECPVVVVVLVLVNYIAAPNARELSAKTKTRCEPLTDSN